MQRRIDHLLYAAAIVVTFLSVARPFWVATYPPMTDLPFHAAHTSVFRHYFDPAYHFREQFELTPIAVPYVSSYVLGAFFMLFLPMLWAVKLTTAIMLLALPAGLATLAWGTRRSPLLGMLGLPFMWCSCTHWGFINFVSALGMFAAVLGLTVRALDKPSRRAEIALACALVLLFFTHIFRFPYAVLGVGAATGLFYPLTKRIRPAAVALIPSLVLFAAFYVFRPNVWGKVELGLDTSRLDKFSDYIIGSFSDPAEATVAGRHLIVAIVIAAVSFGWAYAHRRERSRREACFARLCSVLVAGCAGAFLIGYLTLPMEIGIWWYVFPREATAVLFMVMGLVPDLPKDRWLRGGAVLMLAWSSLSVTGVVCQNYAVFEESTRDFTAIKTSIPDGPRLCYLVFDHTGSTNRSTPFLHLPAYVQAERGGFLSFHFAMWGSSPVQYKKGPDAVVPPPVPLRWEWQPHQFQVLRHGRFFDWFLVRSVEDPGYLFQRDRSIEFVRREGTWWLYHRVDTNH